MLSCNIEKEVQQENKIFMGLSMRKFVCIVIALFFAIIFTLVFKVEVGMYPSFVIGFLCFAFGWIKKDGLTFEMYLLKIIKQKIYKNEIRKYKTKNQYVQLMNTEYKRHRFLDLQDKKVAKAIKKEAKLNKKRTKSSKLKSFA